MEETREPVAPGAALTYRLVFGNRGTAPVPDATLTATLPAGAAFQSADDGGTHAAGVVTWPLGTLAAGASGWRQFSVQVGAGLADGSVLVSEAAVRTAGTPGTGAWAAESTSVRAASPLALAMTVDPDLAAPREVLAYTLTVTNQGGTPLAGAVLTQTVPLAVTTSESRTDGGDCPAGICAGRLITWDLGDLAAGQVVIKQVEATVQSTVDDGALVASNAQVVAGEFTASADAHARVCGAGPGACDHGTTPPAPVRDLAIVKVSGPKSVTLKPGTAPKPSRVKVVLQNQAPQAATVPDLATLQALVILAIESLGACPAPAAALEPPKKLPVTLKPKARLTVSFAVTFTCASDPVKSVSGDYHLRADVNTAALGGGADADPVDDICPRTVTPPFRVDPNPDGSLRDKGCGTKKPDGTFGAPIVVDAIQK
jgi:uncharacterized repeat protein (TIGR01451 family)